MCSQTIPTGCPGASKWKRRERGCTGSRNKLEGNKKGRPASDDFGWIRREPGTQICTDLQRKLVVLVPPKHTQGPSGFFSGGGRDGHGGCVLGGPDSACPVAGSVQGSLCTWSGVDGTTCGPCRLACASISWILCRLCSAPGCPRRAAAGQGWG